MTVSLFLEQYQPSMRYWVFDFDGTLVDSDGIFYRALSFALEPFNVSVEDDFMEQIRHKHPHRIFEGLLTYHQADLAMQRMREIGADLSDKIRPFDGVEKVLDSLHKQKASLSIWTGRDGDSTQRILRRTGLDGFFNRVISGTCVPTNKPGHDGLLEIINHHQAETDEMVMVGDHHHDIEPANALGLVSVHAQWKKIPHVLPEEIKPNYAFGSLDDFHDWVLFKLRSTK